MNIRILYAGISVILASILYSGTTAAAEFCDDAYSIDQPMSNGARWDMCWTHDDKHGIRYHHIHYTPREGNRRMVLMDAAVAQIHVPYDDNGARYHDVSDYGLGAGYLRDMTSSECVGGTRRLFGTKNAVCTKLEKQDAAFRNQQSSQESEALNVYSLSKVGRYVYIPMWRFFDDGRMEPSIAATGSLQRYKSSTDEQHGWLLADRMATPSSLIGMAHVHNYFWRLDFDLNGTSNNDLVQEINTTISGGQRHVGLLTFTKEASRSLSPSTQRTWLIRDGAALNESGHNMSYEIRLDQAGHREVGPTFEPFTKNDFYVTRARSCEQIASHNSRVNVCDGNNLDEFVNGETISNQDIIAWVGVSFYHMPRSEDYPKMDMHSNRFQIIPRDWHAANPLTGPLVDPVSNTLAARPDSFNASSSTITIDVLANDAGTGLTLVAPNAWSLKGGKVTLSNNKISYTAKPGFNGTDKIWYIVRDSLANESSAEVTITVSGNGAVANPFPVGREDVIAATSGTAMTIDVLANDTGNGLVLIAPNAWSLKGGSVALVSNKLRYTAKPGYNGEDKIWYSFKDVEDRQAWSVVTINVTGGSAIFNPYPVGKPDTASATSGTTQTINVLANDIGNGLVLSAPNAWSLKGGAVTLVNNALRYTPKPGYNGEDKIWYTFKDVEGRQAWSEVTITVTGGTTTVNNPYPVGKPDAFSVRTGTQITLDVLANDIGNGLVIDPLSSAYSLEGGSIALSNNKLTYRSKAGFTGQDKVWYTLKDVEARGAWGEVVITVTP